MSKLRLAIIGAGAIGRAHTDLALRHPDWTVSALADPSEEAASFASSRNLAWFGNYEEMFDAVPLDAAIIATPNDTHLEVGIACIARGIAVLVEKPIAPTVEEAQALTSAADKAGIPLMVGHHRRHNPLLRKACDLIKDGRLGRPVSATVMANFLKPDSYFEATWRRLPGGGPILINLIHEIDLMRFLFGEIESLQALRSNAARGFEVEDTAAVLIQFRNGALGTITLSDSAAAPWSWDLTSGESPSYPRQDVNTHFFMGTDASLTLPRLEFWRYRDGKGWHEPLTQERCAPHDGNPYMEQLRHFRSVIEGNETPRSSGPDATRSLEATLAVQHAARTNQPVALSA